MKDNSKEKDIKKDKNNMETSKEEYNDSNKSKTRTTKKIIGATIFFVIALVVSVIFALININNDKILKNISIMGIDVSNMTIEEANKTLNEIANEKLSEKLILKKDDYETSLNANQINVDYDIENAVNEAYNIRKRWKYCN